MKKSRLKKFRISKLFGFQDVSIDFEDRTKILIGENGMGKTTVLNILYFTLTKKFRELNCVDFTSIELIFANKKKISFSKLDLEYYVDRPTKYRKSHLYDILTSSIGEVDINELKELTTLNISEQERRIFVGDFLKSRGIRIQAPSSYIYENIKKFITEHEAIDFHKVIDTIDELITSKILFFPTFRRIEEEYKKIEDFKQIRIQDKWEIPDEREKIFEESDIMYFGMDDVKKRIKLITEEITRSSVIGFSKITGELLSQMLKGFPSTRITKKNVGDLEKITIILNRIGDNISESDKRNILNLIESNKTDNKELLFLLEKLKSLYDEQEELEISIKQFVRICNGYLRGKKFVYDESSVDLNIQRENSIEEVKLDYLSSGEKQIVSLFSKIYLEKEKDFIILFDEPELSLSIFWQQTLLPDILKSNKSNFLLAVTHSPFIYENDLESHAISIEEYITQSL